MKQSEYDRMIKRMQKRVKDKKREKAKKDAKKFTPSRPVPPRDRY